MQLISPDVCAAANQAEQTKIQKYSISSPIRTILSHMHHWGKSSLAYLLQKFFFNFFYFILMIQRRGAASILELHVSSLGFCCGYSVVYVFWCRFFLICMLLDLICFRCHPPIYFIPCIPCLHVYTSRHGDIGLYSLESAEQSSDNERSIK